MAVDRRARVGKAQRVAQRHIQDGGQALSQPHSIADGGCGQLCVCVQDLLCQIRLQLQATNGQL